MSLMSLMSERCTYREAYREAYREVYTQGGIPTMLYPGIYHTGRHTHHGIPGYIHTGRHTHQGVPLHTPGRHIHPRRLSGASLNVIPRLKALGSLS